jgi:hypothetical protein
MHNEQASSYFKTLSFPILQRRVLQHDCMRSGKGGKHQQGSREVYNLNPCICAAGFGQNCINTETLAEIPAAAECVANSSIACVSADGSSVPLWGYEKRDCRRGQGSECSLRQPCTPCEPAKMQVPVFSYNAIPYSCAVLDTATA